MLRKVIIKAKFISIKNRFLRCFYPSLFNFFASIKRCVAITLTQLCSMPFRRECHGHHITRNSQPGRKEEQTCNRRSPRGIAQWFWLWSAGGGDGKEILGEPSILLPTHKFVSWMMNCLLVIVKSWEEFIILFLLRNLNGEQRCRRARAREQQRKRRIGGENNWN